MGPVQRRVRRLVQKRKGLSMLVNKIITTAAIVMLLSSLAMIAVGKWPVAAKWLPLLILWLGSGATLVVGMLMTVWA